MGRKSCGTNRQHSDGVAASSKTFEEWPDGINFQLAFLFDAQIDFTTVGIYALSALILWGWYHRLYLVRKHTFMTTAVYRRHNVEVRLS